MKNLFYSVCLLVAMLFSFSLVAQERVPAEKRNNHNTVKKPAGGNETNNVQPAAQPGSRKSDRFRNVNPRSVEHKKAERRNPSRNKVSK